MTHFYFFQAVNQILQILPLNNPYFMNLDHFQQIPTKHSKSVLFTSNYSHSYSISYSQLLSCQFQSAVLHVKFIATVTICYPLTHFRYPMVTTLPLYMYWFLDAANTSVVHVDKCPPAPTIHCSKVHYVHPHPPPPIALKSSTSNIFLDVAFPSLFINATTGFKHPKIMGSTI